MDEIRERVVKFLAECDLVGEDYFKMEDALVELIEGKNAVKIPSVHSSDWYAKFGLVKDAFECIGADYDLEEAMELADKLEWKNNTDVFSTVYKHVEERIE